MAAGYRPYLPLDELKTVAPDVWIVDGPDLSFGVGPLQFPYPTRMTLIRLPGGRLWVHSPTPAAPALIEQVKALGEVAFLVAPSTLHYWWVGDWKDRFPDAVVFAAPGLERKAKRPVPIDRTLEAEAPAEWRGLLDQVMVRNAILTEVDFFHRASRTLVIVDLIENFERERFDSPWLRWLAGVGGVMDPDGRAPIDLRLVLTLHRDATKAACARMIGWNPERVIVAHGRCYDRDGAEELRRAFRWAL